ncbi:MAG: hypothetical protein Q4Q22_08680, partial [Methanosphaera sp.]|nr:hypothetical protein [Methanosphaera sp.]
VTNQATYNEGTSDVKTITHENTNTYNLPDVSVSYNAKEYQQTAGNSNINIDKKTTDSSTISLSDNYLPLASLGLSSLYAINPSSRQSTTAGIQTTTIGLSSQILPKTSVTSNANAPGLSPLSSALSILPISGGASVLSVLSNADNMLASLGLSSLYEIDSIRTKTTTGTVSTTTVASNPQPVPKVSVTSKNNQLSPAGTSSIISLVHGLIQSSDTYISSNTYNPVSMATSGLSIIPSIIEKTTPYTSPIAKTITGNIQSILPTISSITNIFTISDLFGDSSSQKTQISQTQTNSLITQMVKVVPENAYTIKVNDEVVYNGTMVTFTILRDIFGEDFTNSHVIVYLDGQVIFNSTLDDSLEVQLLKLVESLVGVHELKVEYTDSSNDTKILAKNITIE